MSTNNNITIANDTKIYWMIVSAAQQHQHRLWWFWDSFETKKLHEPQHKTFSLDFCCTINVAFHASNFSKRSLTRISGLFDLVKIVFQGLRLTRCWKLRLYREMFLWWYPRLIGPPAACLMLVRSWNFIAQIVSIISSLQVQKQREKEKDSKDF